ncbi:MAG: DUF2027 domain-containing protein [Bacteroidales bacterium]
MVKIGDKVRFLNAVGGGIVRKFVNKEVVSVEEEDGFETPVLIKECVVIAPAGEVTAAQQKDGMKAPKVDLEKPVHVREMKGGDELNILLAYLPEDSRRLEQSKMDCYLVNDSNYWLMFTYMSKVGQEWKVRYAGMAEPNMKTHLETFGKEDLNDLERVCVQLVAFKRDKPFEKKTPASVEVRLDTVKFYKLHCFSSNPYFEEDALIYPIVKKDFAQQAVPVAHTKIEKALKEKLSVDVLPVKPAKPMTIRNGVIEIDLHIDELLDSTAGMENSHILEYQLDVFRKTIAEYRNKKGQRIVFIHGKGDGILRNALLNEVKRNYRQYGCQDASFREYGYGATMITIK